MKALWIRVEAHDVDSTAIALFAIALGVSKVMALGHSTALAGAIAEHTDDGRIDNIPDRQLEEWARWAGRKGVCCQAVRDHLQAADGTYREWLDTMGKLVDRRAKDRDRKKLEADSRMKQSGQERLDFRGSSMESQPPFRGVSTATERNGTGRNGTATTKSINAEPESGSRPAPKRPASLRSNQHPRTATPSTLPPAAQALLDRFYPVRGDRRADVERQLQHLAAGDKIRDGSGQYVQAYSIARLDEKCADVLAESALIRDLDKAIVVLFTKLGDTSDGAAPGQLEADETARNLPPPALRSGDPKPTSIADSLPSLVPPIADEP